MTRPVFVLKLVSTGGASIHALRSLLKTLLRRHGFRCVSAREEIPEMGIADRRLSSRTRNRAPHEVNMPRKIDVMPPKYFRADGFPDEPMTLKIELARMEELNSDKGTVKKLVTYFERQRSGLVVGSVVWDQLVAATGEDDSDNWKGKVVELYRTTCQLGAKTVPCIRVRKHNALKPTPKKVAANAASEEVPF
jgi:hypothetical protein